MRETLLTIRYLERATKRDSNKYRSFKDEKKPDSSLAGNTCNASEKRLNLLLSRNEALAALLAKLSRVSNRVSNGLDTLTWSFTVSHFSVPFLFSLHISPAVTCLASGVWTPLLPAPHPHNVIYVAGVRYRQISAGHTSPFSSGGSATHGGAECFSEYKRSKDKFRKRIEGSLDCRDDFKFVNVFSCHYWGSNGRI